MTNLHRTLIQQGDNIQLKNPGQVYSESTQTSNRSFFAKNSLHFPKNLHLRHSIKFGISLLNLNEIMENY